MNYWRFKNTIRSVGQWKTPIAFFLWLRVLTKSCTTGFLFVQKHRKFVEFVVKCYSRDLHVNETLSLKAKDKRYGDGARTLLCFISIARKGKLSFTCGKRFYRRYVQGV